MTINEIAKKVNEYKQVILIGESDGQAYIHWNTKDKKELLRLLNNAIHYVSCDDIQKEE